jgi:hypothetical protein
MVPRLLRQGASRVGRSLLTLDRILHMLVEIEATAVIPG